MKTTLRSREKAVYRVINAGVLAGMVLLGGQGFFVSDQSGMARLMMALAVLAVAAGLNFMAIRGRLLCLAALAVLAATGVPAAGVKTSAMFFRGFFSWLAGRGAASEAWSLGYELIWTAFLTGMCYLMQVLFEKLIRLKTAAGILVFLLLAFCLFTRREMNHYGVAFCLTFCVVVWMERIQDRWKKERSRESSREAHTLWIMPFLALYLVLLAVMPAPEKPYDWQWAKNIYGRLQENIRTYTQNIKWGSREGFDMAFSGFSGDGDLRGEVREESGRIMRIRPGRNAFDNGSGNLYLTGRVYDTFDGRGWHQKGQGYPGEMLLDTAETLYAVKQYRNEYQRDYLREVSLEIRYEDFNTGYLFAPLKTWSVGGVDPTDYAWEEAGLRWTRQKGYGTEYTLRYFRMNAGQQEFDRFLEEAGKNGKEELSGDGWEEMLRECGQRKGDAVTREDFLAYRSEIYENYLGEVRLSPKVSSFLHEITQNKTTDIEKLRAIEQELQSYTYTRTPGELPDWVEEEGEFMDYFLLECREGYCTYFATAFVLLARAEGIPARYVQGYCVPVQKGGETYVDSSMAHAWPEVYLEGAGWIPFEPTPGYRDKRYSSWGLAQSEQENPSAKQEHSIPSDAEPGRGTDQAGNTPETEESQEESGGRDLSGLWKFLGRGIPALLIMCAAALAADHAISRYRYRKLSPAERFRKEVFRNLKILSGLGVRKKEWETLQELRERAELLPGLEGNAKGAAVLQFMEDYETVVYGGKEAGADMMKRALQARKTLLCLLKEKKKWAYFYCRVSLFLRP